MPKILLVEDDDLHVELARMAIRVALPGARVDHACDTTEARNYLETRANELPELILLDQHMPGPPGTEFASWVRSEPRLKATRIVMMSADGSDDNRAEALASGIDGFLTKPLDMARLRRMLDGSALFWELSELPTDLEIYRRRIAAAGRGRQGRDCGQPGTAAKPDG